MRASEAFETVRSRPRASYHLPACTAKDWCSQAVAPPFEVSAINREPSADETTASAAWVRQPHGVFPGSSKSPFMSEAKKVGTDSSTGGGSPMGLGGAVAVGSGGVVAVGAGGAGLAVSRTEST